MAKKETPDLTRVTGAESQWLGYFYTIEGKGIFLEPSVSSVFSKVFLVLPSSVMIVNENYNK